MRKPSRGRRRSRPDSNDVFGVLRERIASHVLPPGSRLREQDLASEFGVSRTRIREVLGALEQRGLIERIPNRGAVVVRLDPKQMYDLYDVRCLLEALVARRAAERAPTGTWDDLAERFGEPIEAALARQNFDAYLETLETLHRRMIEYAENGILADMLDLIYDKTQVISRRVIILPGRAEVGLRMHRKLIDALSRKDPDAAEETMREILTSARAFLERYQRYVI